MSQFDVSTLADVTADTSGIADGQPNDSTDVTTWLSDVETRIANLNDAMLAVASSQSGASLATNLQGQLFLDTDDTSLYLDPDGSGADDQVLTELSGYLADCATAGTDTFRIGGPINVDTTQVALAGSTGILESYTLPAGTLARDGQYVHIVLAGTKTGSTATASIQIRFNTGVQHTFTLAAATTDWAIEWWITRTGATAQKFSAYIVLNSDATGLTDLSKTGTDAETLANALAIDANLSAVNAADTVTKEIMIVEFGNY